MKSKWNKKRRKWIVQRCRRGNEKRHVRKQSSLCPVSDSNASKYVDKERKRVVLKPPSFFSLTDNTEETMEFFSVFGAQIDKKRNGVHFFIDSSEVENVTVDALIYLIAILQNDVVNTHRGFVFSGNYPNNKDALRVYSESGFNDYVVSKFKELPRSNNRMSITSGTQNDPLIAKGLSDFVIASLGKTRKEIQPIQKVLIELMSNVFHHAYEMNEKTSFMAKKWYMYAEHVDDYVRCVFVDTGFGIAKTARKNFGEKLRMMFNIKINDSIIIESTFNGVFRSATNEKFRGNGLASVRNSVRNDIFKSFEVISGKGRCIIPKDGIHDKIETINYEGRLYGTLFQFIVR